MDTAFSHLDCTWILSSSVSTWSELFAQVQQEVFSSEQTPHCLAQSEARTIPLMNKTHTRESKDFSWMPIAVATDLVIALGISERFLMGLLSSLVGRSKVLLVYSFMAASTQGKVIFQTRQLCWG